MSIDSIIDGISSLIVSNNEIKKSLENFKKQETFKIKKDAIYETLEFLDDYISWMDLEENGRKVEAKRKEVTSTELTLKARDCYNKLCTTCDNKDLTENFIKLVFKKDENKFKLLNKFRNAVRKELELEEIVLSEDEVFIVEVSTAKLKEHEKTNKLKESEKEG